MNQTDDRQEPLRDLLGRSSVVLGCVELALGLGIDRLLR